MAPLGKQFNPAFLFMNGRVFFFPMVVLLPAGLYRIIIAERTLLARVAMVGFTEIMNEHRAALKAAKFQPTHVAAIMDSLKSISNQERAHR